ncbi:MAG TPA: biotin/lipoyl-containing protein [Streptosporangiaceae bacterium]
MNLSNDDVRDILRLLDSLPFAELHLETDGFRLSLRRTADGEWTQATEVLSTSAATPDEETAPAPAAAAEAARDGLLEVRAPLLGTFYRAPRPGAEPFVEVGTVVQEDSVIGIIETMKLMNSVPAGVRGKVVEICVGNAEFAEQDAVLMLVAPEESSASDEPPGEEGTA